ncbi:MAG: ROK family protein [Syntrophobacteraceae bacterium]|nr:ROK family protein [Syntrophobacteraceae bacterium]
MKKNAIGIDLGGTKIALGRVDEEGALQELVRYRTRTQDGYGAVIAQVVEGVRRLAKGAETRVSGIGIGVAGQVDPASGAVIFGPNLDWHDVPLRKDLEKACAMPVVVTNDVRAATWGEWLFGAGRGVRDLVCVFVGTGIGGGIVCGAKLLEGCSNTAGEIGHIRVDVNGPLCNCGARGCMEALAGGWGLARSAGQSVAADPVRGRKILEMAGGNLQNISAKIVVQAWREGDPLALGVIEAAMRALGAGVATLVNAINPCMIILGGGIAEGMPELLSRVESEVRGSALPAATSRLVFRAAELGNQAGIIGAAALAMKCVGVSV